MALTPDFGQSRMLYVTFSEEMEGGTVTSVRRGLLAEDETDIEGIDSHPVTGEEFTELIYYWDPSLTLSGMAFYDQETIEEWENNLFIGVLGGRYIVRLVIEDNRVVGEERLLEEEQQNFRDIHIGTDGTLYAIADNGLLYQLKMAASERGKTTATQERESE